jgi:hypothetical protein
VATRVPGGTLDAAGSSQDNSSLLARVAGVIIRPKATLRSVVRHPGWLAILMLTTAVSAVAGALLAETETGQLALIDQWERTAHAFGQPVNDVDYARLIDLSRYGALYAVGVAVLTGPVLGFSVAAGIHRLLWRKSEVRPSFTSVFAVVAHAGIILALRQVIAAAVTFARETTASATTVGAWFPMLDAASPLARFLGLVDLFAIWWAIVLAIGIGVVYRRPARTVAAGFLGAYALLVLIVAGAMAATGGDT